MTGREPTGAESIVADWIARDKIERKEAASFAEFPSELDSAFQAAGFEIHTPASERDGYGTVNGVISVPFNPTAVEPKFRLILKYVLDLNAVSKMSQRMFVIRVNHFGEVRHGLDIPSAARGWMLQFPSTDNMEFVAEAVVEGILKEYHAALHNGEVK